MFPVQVYNNLVPLHAIGMRCTIQTKRDSIACRSTWLECLHASRGGGLPYYWTELFHVMVSIKWSMLILLPAMDFTVYLYFVL